MLIGREEEVDKLMKAYDSKESQFVAVYGPRLLPTALGAACRLSGCACCIPGN